MQEIQDWGGIFQINFSKGMCLLNTLPCSQTWFFTSKGTKSDFYDAKNVYVRLFDPHPLECHTSHIMWIASNKPLLEFFQATPVCSSSNLHIVPGKDCGPSKRMYMHRAMQSKQVFKDRGLFFFNIYM